MYNVCFKIKEVIPFFCRWVEDKPVADRLIQIWPQIISIINFWNSLPRSKQPSSKSYLNLKKSCAAPVCPAKLKFFSFFASMLEPYLRLYQTDKPMLPYMCDDLTKLITNVLSLIVKESVISLVKHVWI